MRFIKKANIEQLRSITEQHKELELFISRRDAISLSDKTNDIKHILKKQHAVIKAIHCPSSKFKTICDYDNDCSTNAMSLCEIVTCNEEREIFNQICKLADECGKEFKINVIVIIHTGCVIGCTKDNEFKCPFNSDGSCLFQQKNDLYTNGVIENDMLISFVESVKVYDNITISFENITPFKVIERKNVEFTEGKNFGYGFENVEMAEICNEILYNSKKNSNRNETDNLDYAAKNVKKQKFGTVLDFCHVLANFEILEIQQDLKEYVSRYIEKNKVLLQLIHLSNYDKEKNEHGKCFNIKNDNSLQMIKKLCMENVRNIPITLEVEDGEKMDKSIQNFNEIMLEWNKIHPLFEEYVTKETFTFFEKLYKIMSIDYDDNKNQFYDAAKEIKQYVCKRSKLDEKLFNFTINKQDEINVYAFQLQSYIYYMRYVMLALDLMDEYRDDKGRFERTLSHYIFNDKYDELKFEGLGYYYNIFWKKQNMTLFHCYDGCEGGNWNLCSDGKNFDNILKRCKTHIEGTMLNFYSSSKYFGRCMMKYFNDYSNNDNVDYNICIYEKMPVNYVETNVGIVSLQEYQEKCLENSSGVEFNDFSIDFSDFLKDRDDDIASLNNLFKKTTGSEVSKEKCGSIYDGEVIFYKSWDENSSKNSQNYKKYKLTIEEFYILMSSYFEKVKVQEKNITDIVNEICEKDIELQTDSNANNSIKIITSDVKKEKIEEILNKIDFDIEKLHQPKKENENYGIINDNLEVYINDLKNSYMR